MDAIPFHQHIRGVCQVLQRLSGVSGDHGRAPAAVAELPCHTGAETVNEPEPAVAIFRWGPPGPLAPPQLVQGGGDPAQRTLAGHPWSSGQGWRTAGFNGNRLCGEVDQMD